MRWEAVAMKLTFTVAGEAHQWSRTRHAFDGLGRVRHFNPAPMTDYGHQVATAAALAAKAQGWRMVPQGVPVTLTVTAYLPIPASTSKRKAAAMVGTRHASKPDLENVAYKLIADVLQKPDGTRPRAGVIWDDGQISDGEIRKRWCRRGEERVEVEVTA